MPAGAHVLWSSGASLSAVVSNVALLRAGCALVPVNPTYRRRELAHIVTDVHPAAAVVEDSAQAGLYAELGVPLVLDHSLTPSHRSDTPALDDGRSADGVDQATADDVALIAYTSGTTGAPKGAVLSHANVLANSRSLQCTWRWEPDDRLVHCLPLFHGHGLCAALYTSLLVGSSVVLLPAFDPAAVCEAASDHRASMFFGVPTMYHRLAASGRVGELRRLRLAVSGSAPLAASLHGRMRDDGVDVLERYGMTETLLTISNPYEGERRAGTVGFPFPGIEVDVPDGGEILVRGPHVFRGYLDRPAATAEVFTDGWFRTGDMAEVDDGYVRVLGRAGDVVISGGYNVYPAEVEDVLLRHHAVAEVAVTGTPSDEWGEVVTAWVVPASTGSATPAAVTADELTAFAAGELASYKRPRIVHLVDALPRNAMGKVQRTELR